MPRNYAVLAIIALAAALTRPPGAIADPQTTVWATYLRDGPADTAHVVDELFRGSVVDVLGCTDRWCHVSLGGTIGYLDKDAFGTPGQRVLTTPQVSIMPSGPDCFMAPQTGYGAPRATLFCPEPAGAPAARP
ncbi:MAG: SH3 domain-containing protein [Acidisphaera sp.]|nr:SH3 domain-containing protein [Acidisphaera sp.]MBV9813306.1 SH3 domain-containing protein [Acetobacteraceae bacterium]